LPCCSARNGGRRRRWRPIAAPSPPRQAIPSCNNLACALADIGSQDRAIASARSAVAIDPAYAEGWFNLGISLDATGQTAMAAAAYGRAIRLRPDMGEAYSNLGDLHARGNRLALAEHCYRRAIALRPDLPQPHVNLGELLKNQGRVVEAIRTLRAGLDLHPDMVVMHSNLLLATHYTAHIPPEVIWRAHSHWNDRHAARLAPAHPVVPLDRDPDRRLRIGYVSPDLCGHPVACFLDPLLSGHDRERVEVHCYPLSAHHDAVTDRLRGLSDRWHPLVDVDHDAAARRIAEDRIDILVDLAGHTAGGRPLLFARRPAPIQIGWLGYPDTTGLTTVDYRLTDAIADPPGQTDRWHSEQLVRLPRGFLAFQPTTSIPVAPRAPLAENGFVTFGSFNNAAKISEETIALWAAILLRLPDARLLLKSRVFGDADVRARLHRAFAAHGVAAERIDLLGPQDERDDHFRAYDRLDIALDPTPYNGTTTTCDTLWMGVPVVTLAGGHHVSRVSASILAQCGLPDLIAIDPADYVERAVALARDGARLDELRQGLRDRLVASPLLDHAGFARSVEDAYRAMWLRLVASA